nr:MAG TPA: hypothetical protein [Caudoviricetes sp.]
MLRQLVGKITLCGIRLQLGQDVPDSGQFLRRILKAICLPPDTVFGEVRQGLATRQNRVDLKEISLRAAVMRHSLMP